jgi:hypothetical protein
MANATSWAVWVIAGIVFAAAIRLYRSMPFARDFRAVAIALALVGLAAAAADPTLRWHLLWYTPVALIAAHLFALRRLFALSRRINRLGESGLSDPELLRRSIGEEVDRYNNSVGENEQFK